MIERIGELLAIGMKAWARFIFDYLLHPLLDLIGQGIQDKLDRQMDKIVKDQGLPPEKAQELKDIWTGKGEWQAVIGGSVAGSATGGLISSTIGPFLKLLEYEGLRLSNTARLDPSQAMAAFFRGAFPLEGLESDLRDQGWTQTKIDAFKIMYQALMSADMLTRYKFRFKMPDMEYYTKMKHLGFEKDEAEKFLNASYFYPTPSDLVRWQAREVFEPTMIERYGLDSELGEVKRDAFYKAGMTDEQIQNYWRAHWEHASWSQVTEMLYRGLLWERSGAPPPPRTRAEWATRDAEGKAALYDWFRLVEIPPFWRDKLTQMAFQPFTRVDVRRMHKIGVLSEDEVYSAYRAHGFDHDKAEAMTRFTLLYNATEDRDLTKSDILSSYKKGAIDEGMARELLAEIDYGDDEIDFLLSKEELSESSRQRDLTVSNYRELYQLGIQDKTKVTAALADLGFDAEEIRLLYELWDAEAPPKISQPSRTDLRHFLEAGIITLDTWTKEMANLGYSDRYIEWYLQEIIGKAEEV